MVLWHFAYMTFFKSIGLRLKNIFGVQFTNTLGKIPVPKNSLSKDGNKGPLYGVRPKAEMGEIDANATERLITVLSERTSETAAGTPSAGNAGSVEG